MGKTRRSAATSGSSPNLEELFHMAVDAAKKGQRQGARVMFRQILEQDRRNIRAMMYLAKLAPTDKERQAWLEKVLELRPGYEPAEEMMAKIAYNRAAERNRLLFRLGIGAYVVVVLLITLLIIISAATLNV
jgi:thioredoxin-like negative regulator of GroEL